jgi:hypothetical protein
MKSFFTFIGRLFKPLMPQAKVLAVQLFSTVSTAVIEVAYKAVQQVASNPGLSSSEKRALARDCIYIDLEKAGIEVASSVVNTALEIAYQKLKQEAMVKVKS